MVRRNTLVELAKAFSDGELKRDEWTMMVDNDSSYLAPVGGEDDQHADDMDDLADEIWPYDLGPEELAMAALTALGVPNRRS